MVIQVKRKRYTNRSTVGELWLDGKFECYTLEDEKREILGRPVVDWKVAGKTAIPVGTYDLVIDFSGRFQRLMPHILNVPGFTGIRVHSGNTDKDTEGCILLGQQNEVDFIGQSKLAFDAFFAKLQDALASGETATITIE